MREFAGIHFLHTCDGVRCGEEYGMVWALDYAGPLIFDGANKGVWTVWVRELDVIA